MTERIVQFEINPALKRTDELKGTPFEVVTLFRSTISMSLDGTGLSACVTRMGPEVVVSYVDDRVSSVLKAAVERVCKVYDGFSDQPILVKRGSKNRDTAPALSMT